MTRPDRTLGPEYGTPSGSVPESATHAPAGDACAGGGPGAPAERGRTSMGLILVLACVGGVLIAASKQLGIFGTVVGGLSIITGVAITLVKAVSWTSRAAERPHDRPAP